ncbi:type II secretion system protein [Aquibacillus halophilus]|uniref:Type II secretion system protein n=2 Tax=Aquibacillus halophilus TaxID=930132 RepID=A0A6A8DMR9_9BACI|nr:type II secretion system protein [Aquibacillus halophilus]
MKELVVVLFLFSSFLLFLSIFKRLFLKENRIQYRVNRYIVQAEQGEDKAKSPRFNIQLKYTKNHIRKKFLTKDKNVKLELFLSRSGVPLKPEEYVMFQFISIALTSGISYLIFESLLILPFTAVLGYYIPKMILVNKQKRRLKDFNDDLPEMISTIIGALRAGFSFQQALKSVMEEAGPILKEELKLVIKEMQYGTSVEDALNQLKERMPSEDLDLMIQAIVIQRQVGGNLATVLEKIVETIRDRIKIQGQISTLTAQGRLSGAIVGLLPVILGLILYIIEPSYIGTLFENAIGIILLVVAIVSCIIGFFLIRKITAIEV